MPAEQFHPAVRLNRLHLHSVQYLKISEVVLYGINRVCIKVFKNKPLCFILTLTSELFFFCCPIHLLANDTFTNMPLVRITIAKVSSLDL